MLSWCLFLSDSLFSFYSRVIAPALCLGRITVESPFCILLFLFYCICIMYYFVFGMLPCLDWFFVQLLDGSIFSAVAHAVPSTCPLIIELEAFRVKVFQAFPYSYISLTGSDTFSAL